MQNARRNTLERSLLLSRDVLREEFNIYVADNIDRLEETLSVIL